MVKYIKNETTVVFSEIPDEITLAINVTNCPHHCKGCHSPYLREDIGDELTTEVIDELIKNNDGITCILFMGEGKDEESLKKLIEHIKNNHSELKIGLYTGLKEVNDKFYWDMLDYLKIGPYIEEYGPLNKETTNQQMYKKVSVMPVPPDSSCSIWIEITQKFWKKGI